MYSRPRVAVICDGTVHVMDATNSPNITNNRTKEIESVEGKFAESKTLSRLGRGTHHHLMHYIHDSLIFLTTTIVIYFSTF